MLRKGNKQQFKDLNIPVSTDLAANIRDKQLAERAEHEEMKRLVLDYNQRQEEEGKCLSGVQLLARVSLKCSNILQNTRVLYIKNQFVRNRVTHFCSKVSSNKNFI